jgi:hypothetical protein
MDPQGVMSHNWIGRQCQESAVHAAFRRSDVALLLPFGCNKEQQMAA